MFSAVDLLTFSVITAMTPGQNNILSMTNSAKVGLKRSFRLILGMTTGVTIVKYLCAFFSAFLNTYIPKITLILQIACLIFILYMISRLWIKKKNKDGTEEERVFDNSGFFFGIAFQCINAKLWLASLLSSSTYVIPYFTRAVDVIFWTGVQCVMPFVAYLLWALCGSILKSFFENHKILSNVIITVLYLYLGVKIFL